MDEDQTPPERAASLPTVAAREDGRQSAAARAIQRGAMRYLAGLGMASLTEVPLPNGRRADLVAIGEKGTVWIIEIKSGVADFRSDRKWADYLDFCDAYYFAVNPDFPTDLIPEATGLIVADSFGAEVIRPARDMKLAAARRHTMMRRVARIGAVRLHRLLDPKLKGGFVDD